MRNETSRTKAHLELNLAKDVKDNKKGIFKNINHKRKTRNNVGLLLNGRGTLVTEDTEKPELLYAAFALVFPDKTSPQESLTQEIKGKKEDPGNCWPASLTSIPRKVRKLLILEAISIHMEDKKVIRSIQHGYTKETDAHEVPPEYEEQLHWASGCALEEIAQRGCGVSLTGDIPEPSGYSPVPCSLG
ncbi:hypothetical protein BTVI_32962 [Pitangus sulphuratus]|nr:hypothetical protein BTVI_32962 [Pitangus sulphuratus]